MIHQVWALANDFNILRREMSQLRKPNMPGLSVSYKATHDKPGDVKCLSIPDLHE